jgi:hypothetical protein
MPPVKGKRQNTTPHPKSNPRSAIREDFDEWFGLYASVELDGWIRFDVFFTMQP